jgi:hypothetical protein
MGASLSSRFEWSSNDHSSNHLSTSVQNQDLLYELASMITQIAIKNPGEAKAEFKKAIQWHSSLLPTLFANCRYSNLFNVVLPNQKYTFYLFIFLEPINL